MRALPPAPPSHKHRASATPEQPENRKQRKRAEHQCTAPFCETKQIQCGKILKNVIDQIFHKKSLKHNMGQGSSVEGLPTMGDLEKLTSCKLSTSTHMCSNILPVLFLSWNHLSVSMIIFSSNYTNEESIPWSLAGVHKLHLQALMCSWCPVDSPMRFITMVWERAFHCR